MTSPAVASQLRSTHSRLRRSFNQTTNYNKWSHGYLLLLSVQSRFLDWLRSSVTVPYIILHLPLFFDATSPRTGLFFLPRPWIQPLESLSHVSDRIILTSPLAPLLPALSRPPGRTCRLSILPSFSIWFVLLSPHSVRRHPRRRDRVSLIDPRSFCFSLEPNSLPSSFSLFFFFPSITGNLVEIFISHSNLPSIDHYHSSTWLLQLPSQKILRRRWISSITPTLVPFFPFRTGVWLA